MSEVTLREQLDVKARSAKTRRLDLSFNEISSLYRDGELEISPSFQRIFVWTPLKRSQFIESLLLELPIPPIYVVEEDEGKYILVDGLQRISSYLHFRGQLENPSKGIQSGDFLKLEGCDIADEINGKVWNDLDTALQIKVKRAFVSVQVIRRESEPALRYHMFKRLNDGGTPVSPQQVRNCIIRMFDRGDEVMNFFAEMSKKPSFAEVVTDILTQSKVSDQFDEELVIRFFALKNQLDEFTHHVGEFLTGYVEGLVGVEGEPDSFEFLREEQVFEKTFKILQASTGSSSVTFPNKTRDKLTTGFSAYTYEAVTVGLQTHLAKLDHTDTEQMQGLGKCLEAARLSEAFIADTTGGGKNSAGPMRNRINVIENAVANFLGHDAS